MHPAPLLDFPDREVARIARQIIADQRALGTRLLQCDEAEVKQELDLVIAAILSADDKFRMQRKDIPASPFLQSSQQFHRTRSTGALPSPTSFKPIEQGSVGSQGSHNRSRRYVSIFSPISSPHCRQGFIVSQKVQKNHEKRI